MFTLDNISVYIFNWKKVNNNSLKLYKNISSIINDTCIINSDEKYTLEDNIKYIQLDDSHYYGSQYNHAIKNVKENNIFCCITGDNLCDNNFLKIFQSAINTFNEFCVGVYAPNDKRSPHKARMTKIKYNLFNVGNTDCGFWFIHPKIVEKLKNLDYSISKYGWGIDVITIQEAKKSGLLVIRDYSIETDQLDHSCGYNHKDAMVGWKLLEQIYNKQITR